MLLPCCENKGVQGRAEERRGRGRALGAILQPPCSGNPSPDGRCAPGTASPPGAHIGRLRPAGPEHLLGSGGLRGAGRQSPALTGRAGRAEMGFSPPVPQQSLSSSSSVPRGIPKCLGVPELSLCTLGCSLLPRPDVKGSSRRGWVLRAGVCTATTKPGRRNHQASSQHSSPFSKGFFGEPCQPILGLASLFWGSPTCLGLSNLFWALQPFSPTHVPSAPLHHSSPMRPAAPRCQLQPPGGSSPPPSRPRSEAADPARRARGQPHPVAHPAGLPAGAGGPGWRGALFTKPHGEAEEDRLAGCGELPASRRGRRLTSLRPVGTAAPAPLMAEISS